MSDKTIRIIEDFDRLVPPVFDPQEETPEEFGSRLAREILADIREQLRNGAVVPGVYPTATDIALNRLQVGVTNGLTPENVKRVLIATWPTPSIPDLTDMADKACIALHQLVVTAGDEQAAVEPDVHLHGDVHVHYDSLSPDQQAALDEHIRRGEDRAAGIEPGMEYRPTHTRGEPLPIDLDDIEMRWASQWNESDDGEVRAWRDDIAALIGEIHRLRRVSNGYFEEMVRRTPNSETHAKRPLREGIDYPGDVR